MTSSGVAALTMGVMSFVYGALVLDGSQPYRFGGLTGSWSPATYCFAGTIAAALGAGFVTAGVLGMRTERARER